MSRREFFRKAGKGNNKMGGSVRVKVTMDGDKITKIEVLSHNETAHIANPAFDAIPKAIIDSQSPPRWML